MKTGAIGVVAVALAVPVAVALVNAVAEAAAPVAAVVFAPSGCFSDDTASCVSWASSDECAQPAPASASDNESEDEAIANLSKGETARGATPTSTARTTGVGAAFFWYVRGIRVLWFAATRGCLVLGAVDCTLNTTSQRGVR